MVSQVDFVIQRSPVHIKSCAYMFEKLMFLETLKTPYSKNMAALNDFYI